MIISYFSACVLWTCLLLITDVSANDVVLTQAGLHTYTLSNQQVPQLRIILDGNVSDARIQISNSQISNFSMRVVCANTVNISLSITDSNVTVYSHLLYADANVTSMSGWQITMTNCRVSLMPFGNNQFTGALMYLGGGGTSSSSLKFQNATLVWSSLTVSVNRTAGGCSIWRNASMSALLYAPSATLSNVSCSVSTLQLDAISSSGTASSGPSTLAMTDTVSILGGVSTSRPTIVDATGAILVVGSLIMSQLSVTNVSISFTNHSLWSCSSGTGSAPLTATSSTQQVLYLFLLRSSKNNSITVVNATLSFLSNNATQTSSFLKYVAVGLLRDVTSYSSDGSVTSTSSLFSSDNHTNVTLEVRDVRVAAASMTNDGIAAFSLLQLLTSSLNVGTASFENINISVMLAYSCNTLSVNPWVVGSVASPVLFDVIGASSCSSITISAVNIYANYSSLSAAATSAAVSAMSLTRLYKVQKMNSLTISVQGVYFGSPSDVILTCSAIPLAVVTSSESIGMQLLISSGSMAAGVGVAFLADAATIRQSNITLDSMSSSGGIQFVNTSSFTDSSLQVSGATTLAIKKSNGSNVLVLFGSGLNMVGTNTLLSNVVVNSTDWGSSSMLEIQNTTLISLSPIQIQSSSYFSTRVANNDRVPILVQALQDDLTAVALTITGCSFNGVSSTGSNSGNARSFLVFASLAIVTMDLTVSGTSFNVQYKETSASVDSQSLLSAISMSKIALSDTVTWTLQSVRVVITDMNPSGSRVGASALSLPLLWCDSYNFTVGSHDLSWMFTNITLDTSASCAYGASVFLMTNSFVHPNIFFNVADSLSSGNSRSSLISWSNSTVDGVVHVDFKNFNESYPTTTCGAVSPYSAFVAFSNTTTNFDVSVAVSQSSLVVWPRAVSAFDSTLIGGAVTVELSSSSWSVANFSSNTGGGELMKFVNGTRITGGRATITLQNNRLVVGNWNATNSSSSYPTLMNLSATSFSGGLDATVANWVLASSITTNGSVGMLVSGVNTTFGDTVNVSVINMSSPFVKMQWNSIIALSSSSTVTCWWSNTTFLNILSSASANSGSLLQVDNSSGASFSAYVLGSTWNNTSPSSSFDTYLMRAGSTGNSMDISINISQSTLIMSASGLMLLTGASKPKFCITSSKLTTYTFPMIVVSTQSPLSTAILYNTTVTGLVSSSLEAKSLVLISTTAAFAQSNINVSLLTVILSSTGDLPYVFNVSSASAATSAHVMLDDSTFRGLRGVVYGKVSASNRIDVYCSRFGLARWLSLDEMKLQRGATVFHATSLVSPSLHCPLNPQSFSDSWSTTQSLTRQGTNTIKTMSFSHTTVTRPPEPSASLAETKSQSTSWGSQTEAASSSSSSTQTTSLSKGSYSLRHSFSESDTNSLTPTITPPPTPSPTATLSDMHTKSNSSGHTITFITPPKTKTPTVSPGMSETVTPNTTMTPSRDSSASSSTTLSPQQTASFHTSTPSTSASATRPRNTMTVRITASRETQSLSWQRSISDSLTPSPQAQSRSSTSTATASYNHSLTFGGTFTAWLTPSHSRTKPTFSHSTTHVQSTSPTRSWTRSVTATRSSSNSATVSFTSSGATPSMVRSATMSLSTSNSRTMSLSRSATVSDSASHTGPVPTTTFDISVSRRQSLTKRSVSPTHSSPLTASPTVTPSPEPSESMSRTTSWTLSQSETPTSSLPSPTLSTTCPRPLLLMAQDSTVNVYFMLKNGYRVTITSTQPFSQAASRATSVIKFLTTTWGVIDRAVVVDDSTLNVTLDVSDFVTLTETYVLNVTVDGLLFECAVNPALAPHFTVVAVPTIPPLGFAIRTATQTAIASTGIPATILGGASGGAALQRASLQLQLQTCEFSLSGPLDLASSPTTLGFGDPSGYYIRGSVVGNIIILAGVSLLSLFGVFMRMLTGPRPMLSLRHASGSLALPGWLIVPAAALMQPLIMFALTLILNAANVVDYVIGICGLMVSVLMALAILRLTTVRFEAFAVPAEWSEERIEKRRRKLRGIDSESDEDEQAEDVSSTVDGEAEIHSDSLNQEEDPEGNKTEKDPKTKDAPRDEDDKNHHDDDLNKKHHRGESHFGWLTKHHFEWIDMKPEFRFVKRFAPVFDVYRERYHWFVNMEIGFSVVNGVAGGLTPNNDAFCYYAQIIVAAASGVFLLMVMILRPYNCHSLQGIQFVNAALAFAWSVLIFFDNIPAVVLDALSVGQVWIMALEIAVSILDIMLSNRLKKLVSIATSKIKNAFEPGQSLEKVLQTVDVSMLAMGGFDDLAMINGNGNHSMVEPPHEAHHATEGDVDENCSPPELTEEQLQRQNEMKKRITRVLNRKIEKLTTYFTVSSASSSPSGLSREECQQRLLDVLDCIGTSISLRQLDMI